MELIRNLIDFWLDEDSMTAVLLDRVRCELIEVDRMENDELQLRSVLHTRLGITANSEPWPFVECTWRVAEAYLQRYLTKTLAHSGELLIPADDAAIVIRDARALMPDDTQWYSSETTHVGSGADAVDTGHIRSRRSLCPDRTFEICVAGVTGQRVFLFYAWDED